MWGNNPRLFGGPDTVTPVLKERQEEGQAEEKAMG